MAQLIVRQLDDNAKERLKARAKRHGRSLEAEAREILEAVARGESLAGTETVSARLVRKQREAGITKADVDDLQRQIAELRRDWTMLDDTVE